MPRSDSATPRPPGPAQPPRWRAALVTAGVFALIVALAAEPMARAWTAITAAPVLSVAWERPAQWDGGESWGRERIVGVGCPAGFRPIDCDPATPHARVRFEDGSELATWRGSGSRLVVQRLVPGAGGPFVALIPVPPDGVVVRYMPSTPCRGLLMHGLEVGFVGPGWCAELSARERLALTLGVLDRITLTALGLATIVLVFALVRARRLVRGVVGQRAERAEGRSIPVAELVLGGERPEVWTVYGRTRPSYRDSERAVVAIAGGPVERWARIAAHVLAPVATPMFLALALALALALVAAGYVAVPIGRALEAIVVEEPDGG